MTELSARTIDLGGDDATTRSIPLAPLADTLKPGIHAVS